MPFTIEQFFGVFAAYNTTLGVIPPVLAYGAGAAVVAAVALGWREAGRLAANVLAVFWMWTGIAYHMLFFAPINPVAWGFGLLFVVGGFRLALAARRDELALRFGRGWPHWAGAGLIAYAVVYPVLVIAAGHAWPAVPMFGLTPCPLTLFTIGVLLLAERRVAPSLMLVPLLWSAIGGSAALLLAVTPDLALWLAAALTAIRLFTGNRRAAG